MELLRRNCRHLHLLLSSEDVTITRNGRVLENHHATNSEKGRCGIGSCETY